MIGNPVNPFSVPANPRRVGLYIGNIGAGLRVLSGSVVSNLDQLIVESTATSSSPILDLDFIRHGPIVQQSFSFDDNGVGLQGLVIETLLDDDISNIIQKE